MSVPPLPLDLVRLIVDELRSLCRRTGSSCNKNGLAVALVCKDWKDVGCAMAWESGGISLDNDQEWLLVRLKNSPDRRKLLKLSDKLLALVGKVLAGCEHLTNLELAVHACSSCKRVVEVLLEAVPTSLKHLEIGCFDYTDFDAREFIALLARLSPLYNVQITLRISSTTDKASLTAIPSACLSIRTLDLSASSHSQPNNGPSELLTGLATALDATSLRACSLIPSTSEIPFIHFLSTCPNLSSLTFQPTSNQALFDILPHILPTLHDFPFLRVLEFKLGRGDIEYEDAFLPSPVEVHNFLAALPPSLNAVFLGGVHFVWPSKDKLPIVSSKSQVDYAGSSLRTVLCYGRRGENEPVRSMIMLLPAMGDEQPKWHRMACKSPADIDDAWEMVIRTTSKFLPTSS